jgi:hypothetical protein
MASQCIGGGHVMAWWVSADCSTMTKPHPDRGAYHDGITVHVGAM